MEPNAFKKNKFLQKYTYLNTKRRIANIVSNLQSYALIITKLSFFNLRLNLIAIVKQIETQILFQQSSWCVSFPSDSNSQVALRLLRCSH